MSDSHGNGVPFHVDVSQQVVNQLKLLIEFAASEGKDESIRRALRRIFSHLRNDPRDFGEPIFRLAAMALTVKLGAVRPVAIEYGVHDNEPLVFVRGFRLFTLMEE